MRRYRKWFFTGLAILAVELGFVALLNYIVDPQGVFRYGVWRHDVSHQFFIQPSKNFIKTRYVALNPQKYDCLIFGSSRVNGIDGRQIKNATCYTMSYPDALPRNHLDNLRYILKRGARPRIVLIGLDEFAYKEDPAEHFTDYMRYPYPPAVHQNRVLFYLKYLIRYSPRSMNDQFEGFVGKRQPIPYDHYGTGLDEAPAEGDRAIEADPVNYVKDTRFEQPMLTQGDRIREALEEIRETVDLLKAHGIRLIVFINPIHKVTYLATGLEKFLLFEKELSKITSFYDFSGLNSITTNNYYYYETSHYRRNVGAMMLARMFNESSVKVPADFGVLVTKENIDQHLADLKTQVAGLGSAVRW
ncbi:MAG TPA: hypothetical protein VKF36_05835 [Syntrophorhabdales bacterium]|nr:hypothetical protein [Syntrophorhabdales bacterium]